MCIFVAMLQYSCSAGLHVSSEFETSFRNTKKLDAAACYEMFQIVSTCQLRAQDNVQRMPGAHITEKHEGSNEMKNIGKTDRKMKNCEDKYEKRFMRRYERKWKRSSFHKSKDAGKERRHRKGLFAKLLSFQPFGSAEVINLERMAEAKAGPRNFFGRSVSDRFNLVLSIDLSISI